jgi:predicted RecB family nuclease
MQIVHDRLVLSASDLVGFTYCTHLTELSLAVARGELVKPVGEDPELAFIQQRGLDHEHAYLQKLHDDGVDVTEINTSVGFEQEVAATLAALGAGPEMLYQAAFLDDTGTGPAWRGHADFLRRVPQPSRLGQYSYQPEDTKLARKVKPGAVLQLCNYAAHLERLSGIAPAEIHVVLGDGQVRSFRLADYAAYYRATKSRFEAAVAGGLMAYPDPVEHCAVCVWRERCDARRLADDHLSLVAGIRVEQIRTLHRFDVATMTDLARSGAGEVHGISTAVLQRLQQQARLQVAARAEPDRPPPYELLPDAGARLGLQALPEPDPGDLFFDIEGDPFVGSAGVEYLLGIGWVESDGTFSYRAFWGHSDAEEKRSFEDFMDFVAIRLLANPGLHIYHYAGYERSALARLMGRHATREKEVNELFRGEVLVDLYKVVRQSLRIGTPSYGLKKLEALYMTVRSTAITDGGSSILEYERWLESKDQSILDDLESYNRDDCYSTQLLRDWLEERRGQYAQHFGTLPPRPSPQDGAASERVTAEAAQNAALAQRLVGPAGLAAPDPGPNQPAPHATWLLAQLLDWHRRDDLPEWARYFDRVRHSDEDDLFADSEAVAGLEYVGEVGQTRQSAIHRYTFDPGQEHKLTTGRTWIDPDRERKRTLDPTIDLANPGVIVFVDAIEGIVDLKRGHSSSAQHPRCLVPPGPFQTDEQRAALRRVADVVATVGIDGAGPYRAGRDLLLRLPPRLADGANAEPLCRSGEAPDDAVVRLAGILTGGTLAVQGPPGSGKTSTAARTIVALVKQGRQVGVPANSHAVITNLLDAVAKCAVQEGHLMAISQKSEEGAGCDHPMVTLRANNDDMVADLQTADVLAGTSWLFCRPEFDHSLDYLIIDEAGQLSLANVLALSTAAENLVMVGDPNQLAQPSKGTHPPGVDVSGLSHFLGTADTMPADLGVFLDHTHRLHPDICGYVSEVFYEGRLSPLPGCERQKVLGADALAGSGLRWVPVDHQGNRTSSLEEADAVQRIFGDLVGRDFLTRDGTERVLTADDILVVAPYNAQVALLAQKVPRARVGTVDKFQGRQAAVVIVSMACSSPEGAHRGMDFLYSRNRINVAVSRAQALSIVVASPALLSAHCRTVEQMRLVNGLCRLVELATPLP